MTNESEKKEDEFKSKNLVPIANPINEIASIVEGAGPSLCGLGSFRPEEVATTGMNTDVTEMREYEANSVLDYMKSLTYGKYILEYYDCEDRAFWGMSHALLKFPGTPIGVASGYAVEGSVAELPDTRHAVIIVWYTKDSKLEYAFWDPMPQLQRLVEFKDVKSIIAAPIGNNSPPFQFNINLLPDKRFIVFDEKRQIYPESEIRDFLTGAEKVQVGEVFYYDYPCHENHDVERVKTFENNWTTYELVLWAFAHLRRSLPGVPAGVAIGDPVRNEGASRHTIVFWHRENDDPARAPMPKFWDPYVNKIVRFNPKKIFV